ncbi:hypothetical protein AB0D35_19250 [Streptomyces sp. NPDC048301]|uniref:hypothetical protein n=1 Tax=unclassified Streptomyces TaxID=2593676 RepID=UPI00342CBB7B
MNPATTTLATGPSDLALPLALVAELAATAPADTTAGNRPAEIRSATTGRGRRAARRRTAAVRG